MNSNNNNSEQPAQSVSKKQKLFSEHTEEFFSGLDQLRNEMGQEEDVDMSEHETQSDDYENDYQNEEEIFENEKNESSASDYDQDMFDYDDEEVQGIDYDNSSLQEKLKKLSSDEILALHLLSKNKQKDIDLVIDFFNAVSKIANISDTKSLLTSLASVNRGYIFPSPQHFENVKELYNDPSLDTKYLLDVLTNFRSYNGHFIGIFGYLSGDFVHFDENRNSFDENTPLLKLEQLRYLLLDHLFCKTNKTVFKDGDRLFDPIEKSGVPVQNKFIMGFKIIQTLMNQVYGKMQNEEVSGQRKQVQYFASQSATAEYCGTKTYDETLREDKTYFYSKVAKAEIPRSVHLFLTTLKTAVINQVFDGVKFEKNDAFHMLNNSMDFFIYHLINKSKIPDFSLFSKDLVCQEILRQNKRFFTDPRSQLKINAEKWVKTLVEFLLEHKCYEEYQLQSIQKHLEQLFVMFQICENHESRRPILPKIDDVVQFNIKKFELTNAKKNGDANLQQLEKEYKDIQKIKTFAKTSVDRLNRTTQAGSFDYKKKEEQEQLTFSKFLRDTAQNESKKIAILYASSADNVNTGGVTTFYLGLTPMGSEDFSLNVQSAELIRLSFLKVKQHIATLNTKVDLFVTGNRKGVKEANLAQVFKEAVFHLVDDNVTVYTPLRYATPNQLDFLGPSTDVQTCVSGNAPAISQLIPVEGVISGEMLVIKKGVVGQKKDPNSTKNLIQTKAELAMIRFTVLKAYATTPVFDTKRKTYFPLLKNKVLNQELFDRILDNALKISYKTVKFTPIKTVENPIFYEEDDDNDYTLL